MVPSIPMTDSTPTELGRLQESTLFATLFSEWPILHIGACIRLCNDRGYSCQEARHERLGWLYPLWSGVMTANVGRGMSSEADGTTESPIPRIGHNKSPGQALLHWGQPLSSVLRGHLLLSPRHTSQDSTDQAAASAKDRGGQRSERRYVHGTRQVIKIVSTGARPSPLLRPHNTVLGLCPDPPGIRRVLFLAGESYARQELLR